MRIHAMLESSVNGPGKRIVIWTQGCQGMNCPSCWNPETHDPSKGPERSVEDLLLVIERWVSADPAIEGVTLSGGEPMQQTDELVKLVNGIRLFFPDLSIGMFSGYSESELERGRFPSAHDTWRARAGFWAYLRTVLDFAVLGRYNGLQPDGRPLISSSNQRLVLFTDRYTVADFAQQSVEVTIDDAGLTQLSGFPTKGLLV